MNLLWIILIIILVLAVVGAMPRWGHSRTWGYGPSGGLLALLVIIIILALVL